MTPRVAVGDILDAPKGKTAFVRDLFRSHSLLTQAKHGPRIGFGEDRPTVLATAMLFRIYNPVGATFPASVMVILSYGAGPKVIRPNA